MDYGYLTLVAPFLTLAVAIATRKVPLAMLVGIFTGQLIICGWNPFTAINESVNGILSVCADTGNLKTFLFTALMGAFVILVRISGGVKGFVNYLTEQSKRVKSPRMAMLIAYVIGIIIFIDGLLSIMFTGVVTRPLIDKFKVSREKLAYICDATSAPVNAIIPLNSWGAMLMGLISAEITSGYIQGEPMNLLIRSLPFQFYSILSLLFVLFSCMAFFGTAFVNSLNWALVPDTVDYGEWKTGIRAEGSVYTGYTFSRKISAALAGFLPGIMLTQIGYVPHAVQSAGTLLGLRQLIFLWPCGLAIVAAVTMGLFYKLNEARFAFIIEEIGKRKKQSANTPEITPNNKASAVTL